MQNSLISADISGCFMLMILYRWHFVIVVSKLSIDVTSDGFLSAKNFLPGMTLN